MSTALRYRLFRLGKMTPALEQASAEPGVLLAAEGISAKQAVHALRMARANVAQANRLLVGSLVLQPQRLLASIGSDTILDSDLRDAPAGDAQLTLAADGVRVAFALTSVLSEGSGSIEVHYRCPLDQAILAQLPALSCTVTLENAFAALLKPWKGSWSR